MKVCRWCTYYKPDARYRGVIGWCKVKEDTTNIKQACGLFKKGEQHWLQGPKVEEE